MMSYLQKIYPDKKIEINRGWDICLYLDLCELNIRGTVFRTYFYVEKRQIQGFWPSEPTAPSSKRVINKNRQNLPAWDKQPMHLLTCYWANKICRLPNLTVFPLGPQPIAEPDSGEVGTPELCSKKFNTTNFEQESTESR